MDLFDGFVVVFVEELELVVEGKRIKRVSSLCAGLLSKEWNDRSRAKQQLARGLKYAKTETGRGCGREDGATSGCWRFITAVKLIC